MSVISFIRVRGAIVILATTHIAFLAGCDWERSEDYSASEISADYSLHINRSPGTSDSTARQTIYASFNTQESPANDVNSVFPLADLDETVNLELTGGDRVLAYNGSEKKQLQMSGEYSYKTDFFTIFQNNSNFEVTFVRGNGEKFISTISIPSLLEITTPVENQNFSARLDDIDISWTGSSEYTPLIIINGDCVWYSKELAKGQQSFTVPAGTLRRSGGNPRSCNAEVKVQAEIFGSVDNRLKSDSSFSSLIYNSTNVYLYDL